MRRILHSVSRYAMWDEPKGEALAECFSKYTSEDYAGELGKDIEQFIKVLMTGER